MANRPAPARRNQPAAPPRPNKPPKAPASPVKPKPAPKPTPTVRATGQNPAPLSAQTEPKPSKPTRPPAMNVDPAKWGAQLKNPKQGTKVQGKAGVWWEYDAKKKAWGRSTPPAPSASAGASSQQQGANTAAGGDGDQQTEEQFDIPKTKEEIKKEAQTQVGYSDPKFSGEFTDLMSGLGLGYGAAEGQGYASFGDVFGTPGETVDPSKFVIRDAMGRAITPENYAQILGSDVLSEEGKKNIAGTALGDLILSARRSGAEAAEQRASSGISSGSGVAGAQAAGRRTAGETGFNELLRSFQGGVTGIQSGRGEAYLDALKGAGEKAADYLPASNGETPTAGGGAPKPKAPKSLPRLTPGKTGTFTSTTNKILKGKGTKAQKTASLKKLLKTHSLTPQQSAKINQLIKNLK